MKNILLLPILFGLLSSVVAQEDELSDFLGVLAIAKMTGACGILIQMDNFQSATQMDGGDAFLARFWTTEAARLGLSMEEYADQCVSSVNTYNLLTETDNETLAK